MKTYSIVILMVFFTSCTKDKPYAPDESDYHAVLNINGENIEYWIHAGSYADSLWSIAFYNYKDGLTYQLAASNFPNLQGEYTYRLYNSHNRDTVNSSYYEMCCYEEPDQTNKHWVIYEPDSLNNYMRLHLDTIKLEASGILKATYINLESPFDILHIRCDTFYCKYTQQ